ncbi:MAG TPA: lysylphosphatidylglycerol synthase transmembrane domain-containing protein [Vicinamibacterales bacterium]
MKGSLALLAKCAVSVTLLAILIWQTDVDRVKAVLATTSPGWLAAALACYGVMVLASVWRWGQLLVAMPAAIPHRTLLQSFLVAVFFNNFLPSNVGGDIVRVRDTSKPLGSATAATLVVGLDRLLGLLGLLVIAAIAASAAAIDGEIAPPLPPIMLWLALAGVTALTGVLLLSPQRLTALLRPFGRLGNEWVGQRIARTHDVLEQISGQPSALLRCFAGALVVQVVLIVFYAAIARAIDLQVPLVHLAVLVPVSFLVQMLPVSVNGFGVREAVFSYYLASLRLPLEAAFAFSLLGAATVLVFSLSGAVVYLLRR